MNLRTKLLLYTVDNYLHVGSNTVSISKNIALVMFNIQSLYRYGLFNGEVTLMLMDYLEIQTGEIMILDLSI